MRFKIAFFAKLIVWLLKLWGLTLRIRLNDLAGVANLVRGKRVIFACWHNRLFVVPIAYARWNRGPGMRPLISLSDDGEILAIVLKAFHMPAIRGSSSKQGRRAVTESCDALKEGFDVGITPDGPRGPCYKLQPGVIFLAQKAGQNLVVFTYECSRSIRLKSWDRFMLPLPFSRIDLSLLPCEVRQTDTREEFEAERQRVEKFMLDALTER